MLNFPELSDVDGDTVSGSACGGCTVEAFLADGPVGAYGQGRTFLGSTVAAANGHFDVTGLAIAPGAIVTATATDTTGNTSEFSANVERGDVAPPPPPTGASDSFTRTLAGGWGLTDTGPAWDLFGASPTSRWTAAPAR